MRIVMLLLGGLTLVVLSLTVFEGTVDLQVPMLLFGTLMVSAGLLLDEKEDRRDHH